MEIIPFEGGTRARKIIFPTENDCPVSRHILHDKTGQKFWMVKRLHCKLNLPNSLASVTPPLYYYNLFVEA